MQRNGSGIVICSGGWRLPMTWANIAILRIFGTSLPVEVWHLPGEMTPAAARLLQVLGARPRLLQHRGATGYYNVPFAVAESSFERVLHLGSDVTPLQNLDWVVDGKSGVFPPDLGDLRDKDFYPEAWERLGLKAPVCSGPLTPHRCQAVWETDNAVMALDFGRCPAGAEALVELAKDAQDSLRYGRSGDKELYRLAWEKAGCDFAFFPYPGLAGERVPGSFSGYALVHRDFEGGLLAIHWAYSKHLMAQGLIPAKNVLTPAELDGYAETDVSYQQTPAEQFNRNFWAQEIPSFIYLVVMKSCHSSKGERTDCALLETKLEHVVQAFGQLYNLALPMLVSCEDHPQPCASRFRPRAGDRALALDQIQDMKEWLAKQWGSL